MPILHHEPDFYPESLFDDVRPPECVGRTWRVLHTRPRQEKSLARIFYEKKVPFFLPLIPKRRRSRGRLMTSHVPLFSSYIFLLCDRDERTLALATNRVAGVLEVAQADELWRDLTQIHRLIAFGAPITAEERLKQGMIVEIRSGPLAGLKGKVIRSASGKRFMVQVDFIQRGASIELEDFELIKIDSEPLAIPSRIGKKKRNW